MSGYLLTPAAADDLSDIWDYLAAEGSPETADRVIRHIFHRFETLADFPEMGHSRSDLADESLRVWPTYSYLIVYRPERRPIEILRVVSGFRDLFLLLASDWP